MAEFQSDEFGSKTGIFRPYKLQSFLKVVTVAIRFLSPDSQKSGTFYTWGRLQPLLISRGRQVGRVLRGLCKTGRRPTSTSRGIDRFEPFPLRERFKRTGR